MRERGIVVARVREKETRDTEPLEGRKAYPGTGDAEALEEGRTWRRRIERDEKGARSHPVGKRKAGMQKYPGCARTLTLRYHKVYSLVFPCFDFGRIKVM